MWQEAALEQLKRLSQSLNESHLAGV